MTTCIFKQPSVTIAKNILKYYKYYAVAQATEAINLYKYFNIYLLLLNEYRDSVIFKADSVYTTDNNYELPISELEFNALFEREKQLQYLLNTKCI